MIRDLVLIRESGETFADEVRGMVLEQMKLKGLVTDEVEESNLIFFGDAVRAVEIRLMGEIAAGRAHSCDPARRNVTVPDFL